MLRARAAVARSVLAGVLGSGLLAGPALAQGVHFLVPTPPRLPGDPGPLKLKYSFGCWDYYTGYWLNCWTSFTSEFKPPDGPIEAVIDYTGGHVHPLGNLQDPTRPIGTLTSPLQPDAPSTLGFSGFTALRGWQATKTIDEVSGDINGFYEAVLPQGYHCIFANECDPTRTMFRAWFTWRVGIAGLEELPRDPTNYIRCPVASPDCRTDYYQDPFDTRYPLHPKPFFGTGGPRGLIARVQQLAAKYHEGYPELRLRILDMSVPKGGLMEDRPWQHEWTPTVETCTDYRLHKVSPGQRLGHCAHRVGKSVDIDGFAVSQDGGLYPVDKMELRQMGRAIGIKDASEEAIHFEVP